MASQTPSAHPSSSPAPAPAASMPLLQRRYSVTGQTPPDDVDALKSPKLQCLDPNNNAEPGVCCLCSSDRGAECARRTSNKRSATQLPSPTLPASHLPYKIAKMELSYDDDKDDYVTERCSSETDTDSQSPESLALSCPSDTDISDISDISAADEGARDMDVDELPLVTISTAVTNDCPALLTNGATPLADLTTTHPVSVTGTSSPSTALGPTFCSLPAEIRHAIYLLLPDLVLPYPLIYCLSTFVKQHPLASVSRLVRSEALSIFYSYNTWIIKLEFRIMYEAFQDWIICLGTEGARALRVVQIGVRGTMFAPRPQSAPSASYSTPVAWHEAAARGHAGAQDGDASFLVDLSEKWEGGAVTLLRNDGDAQSGEAAVRALEKLVDGLWHKRKNGTLNGQDWVGMVDEFLDIVGWRP